MFFARSIELIEILFAENFYKLTGFHSFSRFLVLYCMLFRRQELNVIKKAEVKT